MDTQAPWEVAYIASAAHSGSTLLDLLLNNNPRVQSVGEVHRLSRLARDNAEPCTCGRPVARCPFWLRVQATGQAALGLPDTAPLLLEKDPMFTSRGMGPVRQAVEKALLVAGHGGLYRLGARLAARGHLTAAANSYFWYEMLHRTVGARIVVDSSKDARRLKALYLARPERFRLIFLVRDGRAVAASEMRREGTGIVAASRAWAEASRKLYLAQLTIPRSRKITVRYEDLCQQPAAVGRRICAFLGIEFDEAMLTLKKEAAHNISGNPMRMRRGETAIRLDERWRRMLGAPELDSFERNAGAWNRRFGYAPA